MKVYVMQESKVYHASTDCPALNRADRYHTPYAAERQSDGTIHYTGGLLAGRRVSQRTGLRRPCRSCVEPSAMTGLGRGS